MNLGFTSTADGIDLATANACLRAASARRTEQWAALETLLALVADWPGTLDQRVKALPAPDLAGAATARDALGWSSTAS